MSNLVLFAIIGGAELIGKIEAEDVIGHTITISHPLVIRPIQKAPGQYALDLFPHSLANPEGNHVFNTVAFISRSTEVPDMLEKAYVERTSSIILSSAIDQLARG